MLQKHVLLKDVFLLCVINKTRENATTNTQLIHIINLRSKRQSSFVSQIMSLLSKNLNKNIKKIQNCRHVTSLKEKY